MVSETRTASAAPMSSSRRRIAPPFLLPKSRDLGSVIKATTTAAVVRANLSASRRVVRNVSTVWTSDRVILAV